jgi:prepilin signal peptidase PulO-like enzyme (type II secretory pathway)
MTSDVLPRVGEVSAAAACGALVGWIVTRAVARLVEPAPRPDSGRGRFTDAGIILACAAAAAGLWWWEGCFGGQAAVGTMTVDVARATLAWRWAGHVVLLGFLVTATWIDLRDRVIPDAITLPGMLAGLTWAGVIPDSLLPVARVVPRSFAAPLVEADVLGMCGPLRGATVPVWLGGAPAFVGLGVASALFVAWWLGCTAPPAADPSGRRPFDVRWPVLAAGLIGIGAAWWRGGDHWPALLSSLAGMAVGVVLVWTTRIGASRALGREAVGFGDVTLMAVIGAWLGWQAALLVCCAGVFVGLVHGIAQFVLARGNELPFGPSLCAGAALVVVLWRPLWAWVGPVFDRPLEVAAVAAAVIVLTAVTLAAWWRLRDRQTT